MNTTLLRSFCRYCKIFFVVIVKYFFVKHEYNMIFFENNVILKKS